MSNGEDFHAVVFLVPTQGCYQKMLEAVIWHETNTQWHVKVAGESRVRKFRKSTMLHVAPSDRQFPNYRLQFTPILNQ